MTPEQIRKATAELMGWKIYKAWYPQDEGFPEPGEVHVVDYGDDLLCLVKGLLRVSGEWHPVRDRNQSRMVVEKALDATSPVHLTQAMSEVHVKGFKWINATPRDECEAALRATGRWKS